MAKVTDEQILNCIVSYKESHGYNPSIRDIMKEVGFKSTGATRYRLDRMRSKGLLKFDDGIPRSIRLS